MADVLQPTKNSQENIDIFLETIEDEGVRLLLAEHLEDILEVGAKGTPGARTGQQKFFSAVNALIEDRLRGEQ